MNSKWIWLFPHVNGIVIGAILFAAHGFDVSAVIGPWVFIALVLVAYTAALRGLPVSHSRLGWPRWNRAPRSEEGATPVQARYRRATSRKIA